MRCFQRTARPQDELVAKVPDVSGSLQLPPVLLEVPPERQAGNVSVPGYHVTSHVVVGVEQ